ncbi:hypothetical protein CYMTET_22965 [Cymbomonas tetramitiformis]|uniref:K Homology domain-containing protein n=1 Tax=Cymbomonas tetramitiformis TaxID=36881 RepID=A0AAE0FZC0_9CHLO|nr:hypothetical protein CYMTET_22965 [Cymbomonas tetramitiformis]
MSAVEAKEPGYFTHGLRDKSSSKYWGTDTLQLSDTELAYALGRNGTTRRKLARAAGCIIEYVGNIAFFSGTRVERERATSYLQWLLKQRSGGVRVEDASRRDDVTVLHVPQNCMGMVAGNRGATLREVEEETGSFCFIARDDRGDEQLYIFGWNEDTMGVAAGTRRTTVVEATVVAGEEGGCENAAALAIAEVMVVVVVDAAHLHPVAVRRRLDTIAVHVHALVEDAKLSYTGFAVTLIKISKLCFAVANLRLCQKCRGCHPNRAPVSHPALLDFFFRLGHEALVNTDGVQCSDFMTSS